MERNRRATAQGALDDHPSPVHLHQMLDDRKPKSRAAQIPGARLVRPVEPFTQPGNFTFRNADCPYRRSGRSDPVPRRETP